jgi:hypothetical protein
MEMVPDGSEAASLGASLGWDSIGSVALARLRTKDSAPPIPKSKWINTTWVMCFAEERLCGWLLLVAVLGPALAVDLHLYEIFMVAHLANIRLAVDLHLYGIVAH